MFQQLQLPGTDQINMDMYRGYKGRSPRAGRRPTQPSMWERYMVYQLDWINETAGKLWNKAAVLYEIWQDAAARTSVAKPARDGARSVPASRRNRWQRQLIAIWHARRAARRLAWGRYKTAMAQYDVWNTGTLGR